MGTNNVEIVGALAALNSLTQEDRVKAAVLIRMHELRMMPDRGLAVLNGDYTYGSNVMCARKDGRELVYREVFQKYYALFHELLPIWDQEQVAAIWLSARQKNFENLRDKLPPELFPGGKDDDQQELFT